jgi:ankyrin repeat protein
MKKYMIIFMLTVLFSCFTSFLSADEIHEATWKGDLEKIKKLLDQNPELVNAQDESGLTPLHYAVNYGYENQIQIINLLLEKGADVNIKTLDGRTPLHNAAEAANKNVVELLISKGAKVNVKNDSDCTPFFYAVVRGHKEIINLLLANGAEIDVKDRKAKIMLHSAASNGIKNLVDLMISKGADIITKSENGGTLLHSAAAGGLNELAQMMIEKDAKVNEKNLYSLTPLHLAAINGKTKMVELLLANEANINIKSNNGKTSLHYAENAGNKDVVDLLITKGADSSPAKFPVLTGKYLGQKTPALTPELFAPGIVSTMYGTEFSCTFSPDGTEMYFTRRIPGKWLNRIMFMNLEKNKWAAPEFAPFTYEAPSSARAFFEFEPNISPDGKRLFYGSRRPLPGKTEINMNTDIWIIDKTDKAWSNPYPLNNPFKEYQYMMYVTAANNGFIYFASEGGIYRSKLVNGEYAEPEMLEDAINSPTRAAHPFIAPDESYLIFDARGRTDGLGATDLYISFRNKDGSWTQAKNMGSTINSENGEICASVSPDGKYLFYAVFKSGYSDIYWVDASVIKNLKTKIVHD